MQQTYYMKSCVAHFLLGAAPECQSGPDRPRFLGHDNACPSKWEGSEDSTGKMPVDPTGGTPVLLFQQREEFGAGARIFLEGAE